MGVNRCILATRSQFFHELFKKWNDGSAKEGKPRYLMSDLVHNCTVGYEAFLVVLHYLYTGKLKASPPEVTQCVDESRIHDAYPCYQSCFGTHVCFCHLSDERAVFTF